MDTTSNQQNPLIWVVLAVTIVIAAGAAYWAGTRQNTVPPEDSADVGFLRDMAVHHDQAVEMAVVLLDSTEDETMATIATDIMLTQQNQIGQMQAILTRWGYPIGTVETPMQWMAMSPDMLAMIDETGRMPGMASEEQLAELRTLSGVEADALFLELMTIHHVSGVNMAEAVVERGNDAQVRRLAESMISGQLAEIDLMQGLLVEKGYDEVPIEDMMDMESN